MDFLETEERFAQIIRTVEADTEIDKKAGLLPDGTPKVLGFSAPCGCSGKLIHGLLLKAKIRCCKKHEELIKEIKGTNPLISISAL